MIFPAADMTDLRKDVFLKVRKMASNQRVNHPWENMNDIELLKSSGLHIKDLQSGKEGITLAGILIFGKDELISAALSHFKTDAILRIENLDSYERLMQFIAKHLNDKFYLENDQRINIRDKIFREVVSNILIHREYLNPYPAKLIIEKNRVITENSNKAHGSGLIDTTNFSPYPKNPKIAKLFKEIGWVDELGSGIRNIIKYNKIYSGEGAQFIEGDIFETIIPLVGEEIEEFNDSTSQQIDRETKELLEFCKVPRSRKEIQEFMKIKSKDYTRRNIINPLIKGGLLIPTLPDKPTSPNQKYYFKEDKF